jgi:predicted oxidoreductase
MVEGAVDATANSIEDLAQQMGLPAGVVKAEIERYNELCAKGVDEDFGKVAERMYPVLDAPFYGCFFGTAAMLVVMGGLKTDTDMRVLNAEGAPIGGLFAAGNNGGGRFLVEYPVTVAGISLATALSFGRLAGRNAAQSV